MNMENKQTSPMPLLDAIEDEILSLDAEEALRMPDAAALAAEAKACIATVVSEMKRPAVRMVPPPRRRGRRPLNVRSIRRAAARELLVASSSARTIAGIQAAETLSDAEIDEVLEKLVEACLLLHLKD